MTARRTSRPVAAAALAAATLCAWGAAPAAAQFIMNEPPAAVRGLDIEEHLGAHLPLDIALTTAEGERITLADCFASRRPVVMALVYYDCPVACPATLSSMVRTFHDLDYTVGVDFDVAVVSFDPSNTTAMAAKAKAETLAAYQLRPSAEARAGWRFHTASDVAATRLAGTLGFGYRYLPDVDEYAHANAIFVLTPDGRVSRYLYGYDISGQDMKLALLEASEGKIARSIGDRILFLCYHYDPLRGTYSFAAWRLMQAAGFLTAVLLAGFVLLLRLKEKGAKKGTKARRHEGTKQKGPEASGDGRGEAAAAPPCLGASAPPCLLPR